ncbi:MAG TPA: hypothetical protein VG798_08140, partial [Rhizomicrobium sp.]|nr:hypothetical protein [Rhizomicrobium sp.]
MSLSHKQPPPPAAIVIFGANGDLTKRLIVPALYNLSRSGLLPPRLALVGVDHNHKSTEEWRDALKAFLSDVLAKNSERVDEKLWQPIAQKMRFFQGDFTDDGAYRKLAEELNKLDREHALGGNILFYMAVADRFFATIAAKLGKAGLAKEEGPASNKGFRRLIVEKPFGHDLASARALNECLLEFFSEEQIYRIDHF